ncbi:MAG: YebC/PmpR family DNA-binding transcriptional regulator [Rickettsiales bacterium]|nr:YebC/PmpR family DNA-binding transcriptional regulator [Rickettsiales bacterium]
MAGHSQFANIKHRKGAQDKKRAKLFTKLLREITVAAKTGQPDPAFNPRLRGAIIDAKTNNLPKDRIDAAIKKVAQGSDGDNFEEIRYEGYGPNGIALIVEALTDNRNRTASEVRSIFTKSGGALGETGSVNFMFERIGFVKFAKEVDGDDNIFEAALEAGAEEVESNDEEHIIITNPDDFAAVRDALIEKYGDPAAAKLDWKAKDLTEIDDLEKAEKLLRTVDALEDLDDVQTVTGNYSFSKEVLNQL